LASRDWRPGPACAGFGPVRTPGGVVARIDRYILSQLVGAFGLFALILVSIYWLNRAISIFGRLIADGQGGGVFVQIVLLSLPYVVALVLPVAVFAASVWVTNRLTAESERVVMEAAGAGGWRLARPYLVFGLIAALLAGALAHGLVPASRAALADKRTEVARDIASRLVVPGAFIHPAPGVTLFIGGATPSGELQNLFLHETTGDGGARSHTAQRAAIVAGNAAPVLLMFDGLIQSVAPGPDARMTAVAFDDLAYDLGALIAAEAGRAVPLREIGSLALMAGGPAVLEASGATRPALRAELHRRLSQTLAPALFSLLGLAALMLGRFSRFGAWRQIVLAVALAVLLSSIASRAEDAVGDAPGLWPLLYLQAVAGLALVGLLLQLSARPALLSLRRPGRRRAGGGA
jgi:lipopolysaccharide export system permease protein